jgi:type VI secretion system protein ImpK
VVRSAWRLVWISIAVAAVLLAGQFVGLSWALSSNTERVIGKMQTVEAGQVATLERRAPPPPPPPPVPTIEQQVAKVAGFLDQEIKDGIVEVFPKGNTLTIRLAGSGMFGSGSDQLKAAFDDPIDRVAEALNDEPGRVIVVGHSDNVPIRSARFPSNMALSLARAKSVMARMADELSAPERLSAEGRADKEPIADNATREGRAKNRRIEVLLVQEVQE